jgi:hypothetical protein
MQNFNMQTRLFHTAQAAINLEEAAQLIDSSEKLFQQKLSLIRNLLKQETDSKKQEKLVEEANLLHRDYQKSLAVIEEFIDRNLFENT